MLAMSMWRLDKNTAADDVRVEGLEPGRPFPDGLLESLTRLHVAECDLYGPDHELRS
jgi:hypothetical protein